MLREALVVDGSAKACKGVIAGLERGMADLAPGELVLAIVEDIPTRLDVYAWAYRKNHRIVEERRQGAGYVLYVAKGNGRPPHPTTAAGREVPRSDGGETSPMPPVEVRT
jgi:TusA-related sulfurtransferase